MVKILSLRISPRFILVNDARKKRSIYELLASLAHKHIGFPAVSSSVCVCVCVCVAGRAPGLMAVGAVVAPHLHHPDLHIC